MHARIMLLALSATLGAAPAFAQDTAATTAPAGTAVATPPAKKLHLVCVDRGQTGSRLGGRKECHTREEWRALQASGDMALDTNRRRSGLQ